MHLQKSLAFFFASLLSFAQSNAYVARQQQASALQVETAILLDREGNPRCMVGKRPSEYLNAEKLDQFYSENSQIAPLVLDKLRECDEGDEFYAQLTAIELGNEEINLGMAIPPTGKALLSGISLGGLVGCSLIGLAKGDTLIRHFDSNKAQAMTIMIGVGVGTGTLVVPALIHFAGSAFPISGLIGAALGFFACNRAYASKLTP